MNIEQVREYTLSLPGVTEDQPFGDDNITFRLEGKIFLWWVLKISFELLLGYFRADLASRPPKRSELRFKGLEAKMPKRNKSKQR